MEGFAFFNFIFLVICFICSALLNTWSLNRYDEDSTNYSGLFTGTGITFLLFGVLSLTCARTGIFSLTLVSILSLILSLILYLIAVYTLKNRIPKDENIGAHEIFIPIFILLLSVLIYGLYPTYHLDGGRDHGLYLLFAHHISNTGGLDLNLPWVRELYNTVGDAIRLGYPGIYSAFERGLSDDPAALIPQFMHLFPSYGALGHQIAGLEGLVRTNTVIAFFGLWGFFIVGKRFLGTWPSLAATILLAINASMIWVSRATFTEPLHIFILFLGLHLVLKTTDSRSSLLTVLSGIILGIGVLNRLSAMLVVFPIFGFALYAAIFRPDLRKSGLYMVGAYFIVSSLALFDGYLHSFPYLHDLWVMGSLNKLVLANYGLIFGSVLALIINWPEHWREKVQRYLNKIIPIGLVCLMAWIVGRYGLSFLPDADFNLRSIRELGWYVTPVAFLLSLVGFWAFYKEGQWVWIMTGGALFAGTLFIYTWKPSITPDHFWASRRWLSFCIPLIILFSVKAIIALYQGTIKVMAAKRVAQIVSSVLVVWYVGSTVLLARPFVSTSLLASYPQGYSELAAKMKDEASKGIFFTRDGHAASILTYVYNRPTVLVHKNGVEQIESEQKKNWWTLGLSDSVMSQEYINFGSKPTFCGKYTERVRGGRPDELLTHCRQLKMNMLGETNKSEVTDQTIPATHPKLATRVGVKDTDKESLVSQGKPGCLQFGPYVKTEPGKYRITWLGDVVKSQDSQVGRVDVVANKGTLNIAKKIVDYKNNQKQDDTIAYIEFSIDEEVDDLEFRFMVTDAKVILKKIQIESIE